MDAVARSGVAEVVAITEPNAEMAAQARAAAPDAILYASFEELLGSGVDGVAIATPSALHAGQSIAALERGVSVFCQKPLARNAVEARRVVEAARRANQLLAVDLSYRHIAGVGAVRELIRTGALGHVYAVNLVFHNAYGPDKPWFYDPRLSGGGCVIDLGIHLVDLALWSLDFPAVLDVSARLFAGGELLRNHAGAVEDYATAQLDLEGGAAAQLACSWKLHAGCEAVIEASFYGTAGGASLRNTGGSFYDFAVERFNGTTRESLGPPAAERWEWGGRAAVEWAARLAAGQRYDESAEQFVRVAEALDGIYGRGA